MVYVGYCLLSSYGIHTSVGEALWCLGGGMRGYLDITQLGFEDVSEWVSRSSPWQLLECPYVINIS